MFVEAQQAYSAVARRNSSASGVASASASSDAAAAAAMAGASELVALEVSAAASVMVLARVAIETASVAVLSAPVVAFPVVNSHDASVASVVPAAPVVEQSERYPERKTVSVFGQEASDEAFQGWGYH